MPSKHFLPTDTAVSYARNLCDPKYETNVVVTKERLVGLAVSAGLHPEDFITEILLAHPELTQLLLDLGVVENPEDDSGRKGFKDIA